VREEGYRRAAEKSADALLAQLEAICLPEELRKIQRHSKSGAMIVLENLKDIRGGCRPEGASVSTFSAGGLCNQPSVSDPTLRRSS
jgi:hypothetical protein